ncbi:AAA family ATPase [Patescibacteria group bacterium]|nr:AAA family ATPase [Patescibacteria group bacterium]
MEKKILNTNLKLLVGQEMAKELVSRSLEAGGCSTYLLVGPPHVGKGLLARIMAASWHNAIDIGKPNLDTIVFDEILSANSGEGEDNKWKKTVDDTVHLINLSPHRDYRVLIVGDVDRLSVSAANALLKTLEEPPKHARIVITAQNINAVLPTVRSRAQIIRLHSLSDDEIRDYFKNKKVKRIEEIILLANGALGIADDLAKNEERLEQGVAQVEAFKALLSKDLIKGMVTANIKDRAVASDLVTTWTNLTRRLMVAELRDKPISWLTGVKNLPDERRLAAFLARLQEADGALAGGANVRVVAEALVLGANKDL